MGRKMIIIQPVPSSDFNKVAVIEFELQTDAWQASALYEMNAQESTGFGVLGAYCERRLVGYLVYQCLDVAEILRLGVTKSHQKQGIARQLMTAWLELPAIAQADSCLLEVRADNVPALTLYAAFGFKEIAVRKDYYKDKTGLCDALILQKIP